MPETSGSPDGAITQRSRNCGRVSVIDFSRALNSVSRLRMSALGHAGSQFVEVARAELEGLEHLQRVLVDGVEVALHAVARLGEVLVIRDPGREQEQRDRQDDRGRDQEPQRPQRRCQLPLCGLVLSRRALAGFGGAAIMEPERRRVAMN